MPGHGAGAVADAAEAGSSSARQREKVAEPPRLLEMPCLQIEAYPGASGVFDELRVVTSDPVP